MSMYVFTFITNTCGMENNTGLRDLQDCEYRTLVKRSDPGCGLKHLASTERLEVASVYSVLVRTFDPLVRRFATVSITDDAL